MKKIAIAVIILLIIAGVFIPFVNGIILEKIVRQNQSDVNEIYSETGSDVTLEIIQYDRNFKSSDIVWKLDLGKMKTFYGIEEIIFVDHAKHGFTGVASTTSLEKNSWFTTFINDKLNGKNPLTIKTTYGLTGKIHSRLDIDALSIEINGETLEIKPGSINIECASGFEKLASSAVWGGMAVSDNFSLDGMTLEYDLKKISSYIWDGAVTYEIKQIKGKEQDNSFKLNEFSGTYFLDYNEKTLSTGMELGFDSLESPEVQIDDASIRIDLNNLDSQGYEEFMELYTHTIYSALDDLSAAEDDPEKMKSIMEQQMATAGLQMLSAYEKFLKKGLELKISDLSAKLSSGKVQGKLALMLKKDVTFAQLAPIMQQPNLAFSIISLESELSFPAELAQDNPMLTSPLYPGMKTGFFKQEGNKLVHEAETKDEKLFLNGQQVVFE